MGETMTLYLDCEFNGSGGDLISLALVAADGREFYEALPCADPDPWVAQHVMPIIGREPVPDAIALAHGLEIWLARYPAIHVVADWPEDIAYFCRALIVGPGERIDTPALTMEVVRIDAASAQPHNALADARGIRDALMAELR